MRVYGTPEGLNTNQMTGGVQSAGVITSAGEVWLPSTTGAVRVVPERPERRTNLSLLIGQVLADGQAVAAAPEVSVPPGDGKLEIHYTSIRLGTPERLRFKYWMEGFETGTEHRTVTTATGDYTLSSLPARLYDLTIEAAGFKTFLVSGLRVQVAQATRADATLDIGTTAETVTVTAEASLLKTDNAQQGINVSGERLNELPLNFGGGGGNVGAIRNWLGFITLAPGVSGTNERASVNGAPGGAFKIYLEGQDVTSSNDTVWTSTVAAASVETIGEFSMQTANFSAEYGQVLGGVFNFTTKSGTNDLHGSLYDYMTHESLDAHRPFTGARPLSRKHNFGFSAGGPVYIPGLYYGRNKTFFFANLEVFRNQTNSPGVRATVPTDAYRRGDFSAALTGRVLGTDPLGRPIMENAIYDPRTTRVVNGQVVRDPFPNNVIPSSMFDPVALRIQELIPRADSNDILNNWSPDIQNHRYQQIPTVKIDHNIGSATRLSGYWSAQFTDQITAPDGMPLPITSRRDQKIYGHTIRVNLDKTLRPNLQLHVGAGYLALPQSRQLAGRGAQFRRRGSGGIRGQCDGPGRLPRDHRPRQQRRGRVQQLDGTRQRQQVLQRQTDAGRAARPTCAPSTCSSSAASSSRKSGPTSTRPTRRDSCSSTRGRPASRRRRDRTSAAAASASATPASSSA